MKIKQLNLLLYISIGLMAIVNLFSTNALATKGVEISNLYQHSQELGKANQQIEAEINKFSQLSYIQQLAVDQGYQRINEVSLVSRVSLVASNL
jgi:hypothetical protein